MRVVSNTGIFSSVKVETINTPPLRSPAAWRIAPTSSFKGGKFRLLEVEPHALAMGKT
jgi:hypothetical protein